MQTVHRVLGRPVLASAPGGRVCPVADTTAAAAAPHEHQGYISWHRDIANGVAYSAWPFPYARQLKASIWLYDVSVDGAPLTLVPGSHRLPNAPQQTLDGVWQGGRGHNRKVPPHVAVPYGLYNTEREGETEYTSFFNAAQGEAGEVLPRGYDEDGRPLWIADPAVDLPSVAMPNCVRCAVPAGWCVLFDTCAYHVALPNNSGRDRVGTIAGFSSAGGTPMDVPAEHLELLERQGTLPPQCKEALGLPLTAAEVAAVAPEREAAERWIRRRTGGHSN